MLLPEAIDRVQNNVTLQALDRGWFLVTRFAFVGVLDLFDQKLCVFLDRARFELRFFLGQAERETSCSPNG